MLVGTVSGNATARCPKQKTAMNQVGFDDILERPLIFPNRRRQCIEADWAAPELLDEGHEHQTIQPVETRFVHVEAIDSEARRVEPNPLPLSVAHRRKIPNPAK
jgi:hypothetical protein